MLKTIAAAMSSYTATPASIFWGGSLGTGGSICTAEISKREFLGGVGNGGRKLQSNSIIREKTLLPLSSADSQFRKHITSPDLAEYDPLISLFFKNEAAAHNRYLTQVVCCEDNPPSASSTPAII